MIKKINSNRAITLIALVITIVILIILAGVAISLTIGNNGLITRAISANQEMKIAEYKEKIELVKSEVTAENEGEIILELLKTAFDDPKQSDWVKSTEVITDEGKEKIKLTTTDGYIFYITESTTEYKETEDTAEVPPQTLTAQDIGFTPADTNWKALDGSDITNVKQALDYLFSK